MTPVEIDGSEFFVRPPTVKQFREIQEKYDDRAEGEVHLLALCLVDDKEQPAFTSDQVDSWPLPRYMRVLPVVRRAVFGNDDKDDAGKD